MDLLAELKSRIEGAADVMAEFPGGAWTFQADKDSTIPSCIINQIGDGTDGGGASDPGFNTSKDYTVVEPIQVAVYARSPEEAARLAKLLEERFFSDPMPLANGEYVMAWEWVADRRHKDLHPDSAGNPVYHYSTDYDAKIQRKRA